MFVLQPVFSTNKYVTGFPRIFNPHSIVSKTKIVNMGTASSHEYAKKQYMPELLGQDRKGEGGTGRGTRDWKGNEGQEG